MKPPTPTQWKTLRLSVRQMEFMKLLCRFHLSESTNEWAKHRTRSLLWCLEHWPKEIASIKVLSIGEELPAPPDAFGMYTLEQLHGAWPQLDLEKYDTPRKRGKR